MHRARVGVRRKIANCGELPFGPGALLSKGDSMVRIVEIFTMSMFDDLRSTAADGSGRPDALVAAQMDVLGASDMLQQDGTDGMETH